MYEISIQRAVKKKSLPENAKFKQWATGVLQNKVPSGEITIRIVEKEEITELNSTYRQKNKPTNVLSFPFDDMPEELSDETPLLGDIIICADVIEEEALEQHKTVESHWAHMVVHGTLHLLGYDHEKDHDAEIMEAEEIKILNMLGFSNPYEIKQGEKNE